MIQNIIVLMGPPGCGKSTQGIALGELLSVPVISTGAILRAECESGTPLGKAVQETLERGDLVSDDVINQVVANWIAEPYCEDGFILDGYPRTVPQAKFLDRTLESLGMKKPSVIQLDIPSNILLDRINGRRQCRSCGRIYHLRDCPPARDGLCDDDGESVVQRPDDADAVIQKRLRQYEEAIASLVEYYSAMNFRRVDGSDNPAMVLEAIEAALGLQVWQ